MGRIKLPGIEVLLHTLEATADHPEPMKARIPLTTLSLETMHQSSGVWEPDDDWTGKTNVDDRRRLQNRLNQRTQRHCLMRRTT